MGAIEFFDNFFQILTTLVIFVISLISALRKPNFIPFQYLAGASLALCSGTIFWTVYFLIYGDFPYYFSASEICYMAFYLFLIGICLHFKKENKCTITCKTRVISLILPCYVFVANTICYYLIGGLFWILYYAVPFLILAYFLSLNLFTLKKSSNILKFHLILALFVISTNTMYVFSSFYLNNLYLICDFINTLTFPFMYYFIKKESLI